MISLVLLYYLLYYLFKNFNDFFSTIVDKLNIPINDDHISETYNNVLVRASIQMFTKHTNILNIDKRMRTMSPNLNSSLLPEIRLLKKYRTLTPIKP